MSFDISESIGQMASAMEQSVGQDISVGAGQIASFAAQALSKQKESLAELAQARLENELDQDEFEEELQREMLIVETEMLTADVMAKAAVQKAIQAAITVLSKAVMPI